MHELYHYRARVLSVYDGDSFHAAVDLGMNIEQKDLMIRLAGIDAPEIRGDERPEGLKAEEFLRGLIGGEEVILRTYKDDTGKYGRYYAEVYVPQLEDTVEDYETVQDMVNVSDLMVEEGFAEKVEY